MRHSKMYTNSIPPSLVLYILGSTDLARDRLRYIYEHAEIFIGYNWYLNTISWKLYSFHGRDIHAQCPRQECIPLVTGDTITKIVTCSRLVLEYFTSSKGGGGPGAFTCFRVVHNFPKLSQERRNVSGRLLRHYYLHYRDHFIWNSSRFIITRIQVLNMMKVCLVTVDSK